MTPRVPMQDITRLSRENQGTGWIRTRSNGCSLFTAPDNLAVGAESNRGGQQRATRSWTHERPRRRSVDDYSTCRLEWSKSVGSRTDGRRGRHPSSTRCPARRRRRRRPAPSSSTATRRRAGRRWAARSSAPTPTAALARASRLSAEGTRLAVGAPNVPHDPSAAATGGSGSGGGGSNYWANPDWRRPDTKLLAYFDFTQMRRPGRARRRPGTNGNDITYNAYGNAGCTRRVHQDPDSSITSP